MLEDAHGRRSARDWIVDVAMFCLAAGIGIFILVETWDDHDGVEVLLDFVLGAAALLALWFRRSRPTEVAVFTVVASSFSALAGGPGVVALFNAAIRTPGRTLAIIVGLGIAATAIFPLFFPGHDPYGAQLLVGALINAVVVGWGLFVRAQRELVHSLHERAQEREAEHRLHVEQAREAERRRIAREMHDVLAHRVSLLSLHAGALEFRPDAPAEEVAEAAGVIRATARDALEELRQVIGVLREGQTKARPSRRSRRSRRFPHWSTSRARQGCAWRCASRRGATTRSPRRSDARPTASSRRA
jgi:signal transduction histidine kinase